jgi:signal transduction histidine kinase
MAVRKSLPARIGTLINSIRFKLVLWFAFILALVLAAFSVFVYVIQSRDVHTDVLTRLERRVALLVGTRTFGSIIVPDNFIQENEILVLTGPDGKVLASQGTIPAQDVIRLAVEGFREHPLEGGRPTAFISWTGENAETRADYQFLIAPIVDPGGVRAFVILGTPLDPGGQLHALLLTLLFGSLLTLGIALGGGLWLADRAMRPVHTITRAAREISDTDLSRRLNLKGRDELGELANTFDAMLARLQAAFERQRQFVADASHELRTPLTIVNLEASRALAARRSGHEYQRALGTIRSENDFMIRLVNDLLALARMDAGQAPLALEPLDLSDVALEAVERLADLAARRGVRLVTGDLPEVCVRGDRQYLLQMVTNLVENGIKYTAGEEPCVRLETGRGAEEAWVRVSDNGPGIAPEHLPHLFDRFYRVDQARARREDDAPDPQRPSGSGLGLSIVQWIARVHGGEVRVSSQVGQGTTFEVTFPAAESQALPNETAGS